MRLALLETFAAVPWMRKSLPTLMTFLKSEQEMLRLLFLLQVKREKADLRRNDESFIARSEVAARRISEKLKRKPSLVFPLDCQPNVLDRERTALVITVIQAERSYEAFVEEVRVHANMARNHQARATIRIRSRYPKRTCRRFPEGTREGIRTKRERIRLQVRGSP